MELLNVKNLLPQELLSNLVKLKKELMVLRFQKAAGELKNTAKIGQVRRSIARVYTALNNK